MITNANELKAAIKRNVYCGVILYEGPSILDGMPIVVIANRIVAASDNAKTGAMVQTFIMRADIGPVDALRTGDDSSICGMCPHRPVLGGGCYVNVGYAPLSTWNAYKRNRYARPGVDYCLQSCLPELFADSVFRLGAYGDPAAAPFAIWELATRHAKARNGYTHQWRTAPAFKALCMASVDNEAEAAEAVASGWRYFRVRRDAAAPTMAREVVCPASKEAGARTQCADCRACGGLSSKARANIVIADHGPKRRRRVA